MTGNVLVDTVSCEYTLSSRSFPGIARAFAVAYCCLCTQVFRATRTAARPSTESSSALLYPPAATLGGQLGAGREVEQKRNSV